MKSLVVLLIALMHALPVDAQEVPWSWFWVQTGPSEPLVFRGSALSTSSRNAEWTFKVTQHDKSLDDFVVHARKIGNEVVARFEPPNTERGMLQIKGVHKVSPAGSGQVLEQVMLADAQSGQLMVFTRFKKSK